MKTAILDHVGIKAGMDYYSSSLAKGLTNSDCKTFVFSNFTGIFPEYITYKAYFDGHNNDNKIKKLLKLLSGIFKASYLSKKENIDLVIVHLFATDIVTFLLTFIPKIFGLKVAIISHDVSSFADNDNKFIENMIYNTLSDYIIVHNNFSHQELLKNVNIKDKEKIKVIKHGGYLDHIEKKYSKEEYRRMLDLNPTDKYILFFGQIKKVKGLDILINAMSKVDDDIKLIIAGKPWKDDFKTYDDLISKLKLENRIIKIIRFIEDDEREKLFFAADINVLPYRVIYQSGVLLMAMSHSLPVIASNLEANMEIITDRKNGLLFESENADDLASKIKTFFSDKELNKQISNNSITTIKDEYNWDDIGKSYIFNFLKK